MRAQVWTGVLAAVVLLAGCTAGGVAVPEPTTAGRSGQSGLTSAAGTAGTGTASTGTASTSSPSSGVGGATVISCDPLEILPCARQVNRVVLPIAGTSTTLLYSSDRQTGREADAAPSAVAVGLGGWSLSTLPGYDPAAHLEVLPNGTVRTVVGIENASTTTVVDPNGSTETTFDASGRAMATVDAVTGLPLTRFTWNDHGLATVTDAAGVSLSVDRDASGKAVGLRVPGTTPMTLAIDGQGMLIGVGYPDGTAVRIDPGSKGLVASVTDGRGQATSFGYDEAGRLTSRIDPTGATTTYRSSGDGNGTATVVTTLPEGATTSNSVSVAGDTTAYSYRGADGVVTTETVKGATRTITSAGATTVIAVAPDPRWGSDVQIPVSVAEGGATMKAETTVRGTATHRTVDIDGAVWIYDFDPGTRTAAVTDPAGKKRTTILDAHGRVTTTAVDGVPAAYGYDRAGRVVTITLGTGKDARAWRYRYGSGSVVVTDPTGSVTTVTVDANGRTTGLTGALHTGGSHDPRRHR